MFLWTEPYATMLLQHGQLLKYNFQHGETVQLSGTPGLFPRAGLTIRGVPYQRKARALFSYAEAGFFSGVHFSSPNKLMTFFKVVLTSNV